MKIEKLFQALLVLLLLTCAHTAGAQEEATGEKTQEPRAPSYRLELIWIVDGDDNAREYVFTVGAVGFKTVEGLKNFIARLPRGAVLEWSPGCRRQGDEPLLSSSEEMEAFKRFCAAQGVEFILHPSG
jgi:hypothetical protein